MPFTAAHPAIVLPFLRIHAKYISPTALVIGSMAPDFEYFFRMKVRSVHGHTIPGLLYFDLPVTLILAFAFHTIVKRDLIRNLPQKLQRKFHTIQRFNFLAYIRHNYFPFFISAIAGSATHLFWDSFTHRTGHFSTTISFIHDSRVRMFGSDYSLYTVLQHASTVLGLAAICLYVISMEKENVEAEQPRVQYWFAVLLIVAGIVSLRFLIYSDDLGIGNLVVTFISGLCLALMIMGLKEKYI
jgi:hypothetical protein